MLRNGLQLRDRYRTRVWAASVAEGWIDVVSLGASGFAREQVRKDSQGWIIERGPITERLYGDVVIRRKAGW